MEVVDEVDSSARVLFSIQEYGDVSVRGLLCFCDSNALCCFMNLSFYSFKSKK